MLTTTSEVGLIWILSRNCLRPFGRLISNVSYSFILSCISVTFAIFVGIFCACGSAAATTYITVNPRLISTSGIYVLIPANASPQPAHQAGFPGAMMVGPAILPAAFAAKMPRKANSALLFIRVAVLQSDDVAIPVRYARFLPLIVVCPSTMPN